MGRTLPKGYKASWRLTRQCQEVGFLVTLVTCKQSFPFFSGQRDGFSFGSISTSSVLWRSLQTSSGGGHRRIGKGPQHMSNPSLQTVAFRVAQLYQSLPDSSWSPSGSSGMQACIFPSPQSTQVIYCRPRCCPLKASSKCHLLAGTRPFQWWAVSKVCCLHSPWAALLAAAASTPCLLAGVISQAAPKKKTAFCS